MGQGADDAFEGAGEAITSFVRDTARDGLEAGTLGTIEFDDDFNIGPGDNTRESLRLTGEGIGALNNANAQRKAQSDADARTDAEIAKRKQDDIDQLDFERRLDIAASNRAQSIRPKASSGSRTASRSTSSRGTVASKASGDFLGL